MSGQVPMTFESVPAVMPFHREGEVRLVAVSSPERLPSLPDVPTFVELGYPSMAFYGWFGLVAPVGTPAPIIRRLARPVAAASRDAEYRQAIAATGQEVVGSTPEEIAEMIATDTAQWRAIVEGVSASAAIKLVRRVSATGSAGGEGWRLSPPPARRARGLAARADADRPAARGP
jgi:tripartite-type tricarboxylate transporter receptor subunit TctC